MVISGTSFDLSATNTTCLSFDDRQKYFDIIVRMLVTFPITRWLKINLSHFPEFADLTLMDLEVITTLGIGGFGRVELVQVPAAVYDDVADLFGSELVRISCQSVWQH